MKRTQLQVYNLKAKVEYKVGKLWWKNQFGKKLEKNRVPTAEKQMQDLQQLSADR